MSLFPKEQRESLQVLPRIILRQNACCISEYVCWYVCRLLCPSSAVTSHTAEDVSPEYIELCYMVMVYAVTSSQLLLFFCNSLLSPHKRGVSFVLAAPILLRCFSVRKLEIISTSKLLFHQVLSKTKGGEGCPCLKIQYSTRRRHRQHNHHITASETRLDGYLSKAIPHLRIAVQLLLHYHTSTSSSLALLKHPSMPSRFFTSESAHRTPLLHSHSAPIAFSPHSYALLWVC